MTNPFEIWKSQKKIPIYLVIHIGMINPYVFDILKNIISYWKRSGLWDITDRILCGVVGNMYYLNILRELFEYKATCIVSEDDTSQYERTTLHALYKYCKNQEEDFWIFYCHTKGVTKSPFEFPGIRKWMDSLLYFECCYFPLILMTLQNNEEMNVCGVGRSDRNDKHHFSGNFWWSSAKHIRELKIPIGSEYLDPELWIGSYGNIHKIFSYPHGNWYIAEDKHWVEGMEYQYNPKQKTNHILYENIPSISYYGIDQSWIEINVLILQSLFLFKPSIFSTIFNNTTKNESKKMWIFIDKNGLWNSFFDDEIIQIQFKNLYPQIIYN